MESAFVLVAMVCACFTLSGQPAAAQVSYEYTGRPFTLFSCGPSGPGTGDCPWGDPRIVSSYTPSDFVSATLKLSTALGPNLNFQDVSGLPGFQLTMSDGVQTFSTATHPPGVLAEVSTDGSGNIIAPWFVGIFVGGSTCPQIFSVNEPGSNFVLDQAFVSFCADPTHGDIGLNQSATFPPGTGPGTWGAGGVTLTHNFGTFTRIVQHTTCCDGFVVDNVDAIQGGVGQARTFSGGGSTMGEEFAAGALTPLILNGNTLTNNGLNAGAWSDANLGVGSGRGLAFATYTNNTNTTVLKVNAVLDGELQPDVFGLPDGNLTAGGAIHVYDTDKFNAAITAGIGSGTLGQFLLGSSPSTPVIPNLASANIGEATVGFANGPFTPPNPPIAAPLSAQFTIPIGKSFTVVFDVTASGVTQGGGCFTCKQGTGFVNFINTLKPAANFFTDASGNAVTGITAVGAPAVLPAGAASLTLAPSTGSNVAGSQHTVTATETDSANAPVPNSFVNFTVISGPNVGVIGGGVTDSSGQTSFTYTGKGGPGTDSIKATGGTLSSNTVQEIWQPAACTQGQGYWKNHSNAWPVSSLTLGSQNYSKTQLLQILGKPGGGDASVIMAVQLIAAKLNVANGSDPTPVSDAIAFADGLLKGFSGMLPYNVQPSSATGQLMTQGGGIFDNYNSGKLTPRCSN